MLEIFSESPACGKTGSQDFQREGLTSGEVRILLEVQGTSGDLAKFWAPESGEPLDCSQIPHSGGTSGKSRVF